MHPAATAHPYRDTDVVDARAPRFLQGTVGLVSLLALLTGWWALLAVLALQLAAGLVLGRRYCLPCVFYFEVVQPRLGEGEVEDARPVRFANIVGLSFLTAASLAHAIGWIGVGRTLAGMVATLALLAAATGFCAGCEMYKLAARLRGVRPGHLDNVDLADFGLSPNGRVVVGFTHPLCTGCREMEHRLEGQEGRLVLVDISKRHDLARKYHVAVVPTAVAVEGDGRVVARLA
ncbi:MAG TPA: DUF4395 domain-containing protein [Actinomycetota bacterium]|nr:DUF4395 domain-containing protein [Actinomycetota bacterium]